MKRWGALALVLFVAGASSATARPRGAGGFRGGRFSGRYGGSSLRLGFGSRFGFHGFSNDWGYPGVGYVGFPGYGAGPGFGAFPGFANFGYGFPYPIISTFPTDLYLPFLSNAIGISRGSLPWSEGYSALPNTLELPPRVVVLGGGDAYTPRFTDGSARLGRSGERYYLEPREPEPVRDRPAAIKDVFRRNLRVESADTTQYVVRWTGDPSELVALELTALDAERKVVMRRLVKAAPFRGLLNTGGKTTTVTLSLDVKDGPTVTLEYPLERFQALAGE